MASIDIKSADYWFKLVEMLQQNWALIECQREADCIVYFIHDESGVFDRMEFESRTLAEEALRRNGFKRFLDDPVAHTFIRPPSAPFFETEHPNGPIYSSGRFWK